MLSQKIQNELEDEDGEEAMDDEEEAPEEGAYHEDDEDPSDEFSDEEEVIKLMNDNSYGLAAGVFTENNGVALRVSKAVRAGIVFVNTYRLISPIAVSYTHLRAHETLR